MLEKALITGGSGLFGLNFILQNKDNISVIAHENKRKINIPSIEKTCFSLNDINSINSALIKHLPDYIIHAAGMTSVEACEENPEKANIINGTLAANIAKVAFDKGIKFIHISTDHLFDGNQSFVSEEVPLKPINAYGYSKALGEDLVLKNNPDSLIIRCNFFGWGPSYRDSFSDFLINNLKNKNDIKLAHDYHYTPSSTRRLINRINELIAHNANGIFNVVGSERVSKYEFGLKLAEIFSLNRNYIEKVSLKSLDIKTPRPADMSLCDKKLHNFLGKNIGIISENIIELKEQIDTKLFNIIKTL